MERKMSPAIAEQQMGLTELTGLMEHKAHKASRE